MNNQRSHLPTSIFAFVLGVALAALLLWNPLQWEWAHALVALIGGEEASTGGGSETQLWTCGMHPQVLQGEPGTCPICGMNLVPVKGAGESGPEKEREIKHWVAPMDPTYISDKPGKSPMGMDLIPVYEEEQPEETGVRVDPNFVQNFAIRKAQAEIGSIPIQIRTLGILAYNQKSIVAVNTKFDGWIEKAYVNYIGESVRQGDALFEIFSPQLVTTQQEYLAAVDYLEKLSDGGEADAVERARSLLSAAHERLRYWDITDDQVDDLRRNRSISRTLKVFSPVTGVVIEKMGDSLEGVRLAPGLNVYKIADVSTVWAEIEFFEYQIQYLRKGQRASIFLDAFPGRRWMGNIAYLDPKVDSKTRTLKAYVEVANPDRKLRPEMYARVEISVPAPSSNVIIPEEAVLRSGERIVVIVEKSEGLFEPREVTLGTQGGGYQAVLHGLEPGETVVTSSQFLIDSESNLKEAITKMLAVQKEKMDGQSPPEDKRIR
jgi:Cu(I)/Ag(I) efflux system membrane fusion protein/cobalt-zinc-cadmium efflux system membrane fusion protein